MTYAIFASCLKREKDRYEKEKYARYALLKRNSDEEDDEVCAAVAGPFENVDKFSDEVEEHESMLLRGSGSTSRHNQSTLPSSVVGGGGLEAERHAEVDDVLRVQRE